VQVDMIFPEAAKYWKNENGKWKMEKKKNEKKI
jgi:hypothetical protein